MATNLNTTPKAAFEAEFDRQVNGGLCGGDFCINPDCYCDEIEEEEGQA